MTDDDYRRMANYAGRKAQSAKNDEDREAWLRVAQGWMNLIRGGRQGDTDGPGQSKLDR
jgi:hypothetical protein